MINWLLYQMFSYCLMFSLVSFKKDVLQHISLVFRATKIVVSFESEADIIEKIRN